MTEGDSLSVAGNGRSVGAPDWVADELAAPASRGASGALQVSGEPGGTINLSDGCLAFADIQWTRPDPAVLRQILAELRQLG